MPKKRKDSFEESIEECVKEIKTTIEEADSGADPQEEIDRKREELIRLSEDGQIDKSVASIRKANKKTIEKIYNKYERDRMEKANIFLTDLIISKYAKLLGGFDAIENPEVLKDELKKDDLLKRDVQRVAEMFNPYIPYLGILSGGITTVKRVYNPKNKPEKTEKTDKYSNEN